MRNYFELRGTAQQLTFDPITKQFLARSVGHEFQVQRDPLELHLLNDLGIDAKALDHGMIKLVA